MADPTQTPQRGNWVCPCGGCKKARKQAYDEVMEILFENNELIYNAWRVSQKYHEEFSSKKK